MNLRPARVGLAAILLPLAGCAHPAPPVAVMAPVAPGPSPQALRNEWQKGFEAGFYEGRRDQARRDQALLVPSTLPPPPPPPETAAAAPAAAARPMAPVPAVSAPAVQAPPQSVFVPAGPAEPVTSSP